MEALHICAEDFKPFAMMILTHSVPIGLTLTLYSQDYSEQKEKAALELIFFSKIRPKLLHGV